MNFSVNIQEQMQEAKMCVIVPTYNNDKTLATIIEKILSNTSHLIVVNDGSTDSTYSVLKRYPFLNVVHLKKNLGKGKALHKGFCKAIELGYEYAITIDSDGQHYPEDIAVFVSEYKKHKKPLLLIGSRNMTQEGVPKRSSFGNRFSNFWYKVITGIRLSDTQSGYRLYPLKELAEHYFTTRFEFEIEIIVRMAWKGVAVRNVPIQVLYNPTERVTHFRPFKDFMRISLLNTVLVFIALVYIKPRDIWYKFKKKSFRRFFKEDILRSDDTNEVKALSIALGVFIGIAPFWGFQSVLSVLIATLLGWNKVLSFAFSNISIPPMIPIIVFTSLWVGSWFVDGVPLVYDQQFFFSVENVKNHLLQYLLGSIVLAVLASAFVGVISYLLLKMVTRKK